MIVKNAGDTFKEVLEKNIPHIDRWTILDTGSTDNTVQVIQETLAPKVRGELFQEPFIDFGTSRNRALELAGQVCKFTLMLDDTYYIEGDLRGFLNEIRSDQFSDSFSLYITSDDVQYVSNRLLKTHRQLKYWYKIHEVIQEKDNKNVIVPIERARIHDKQSDYMQNRTITRKTLDLKLLKESIQEDPDVPRHYYYMAQTYVGMENWEMAYKYFLHRVYHHVEGFLQEKIDACFEAARTAQFRLNRPWEEVKPLYEKAYEMDPSRPDSVYFLGVKEFLDKNYKEAYKYFKKAFEIGYPIHAQYSLKPTLSYHFNPKFLVNNLCWTYNDYALGEAAAELYIRNNPSDPIIESWYAIYKALNQLPPLKEAKRPDKPYLCFVADGNWNKWTGKDVEEKGLGGSETYIVEMARWIEASGEFQVMVFCRCSEEESYGGVQYLDLSKYYAFITENIVHTCIVSRFSEYLPATYKSHVENVFLVVHDLTPTGLVVIRDPKFKGVFTLTEWHKTFMDQQFPVLNDLTTPLHYGIHSNFIQLDCAPKTSFTRFIYSSFPNRGLLPLLEMWPQIRQLIPNATLDVYSNLQHPWCLQHHAEQMARIQTLIHQPGVKVYGWVSKARLSEAWKAADVWLYPCIFQETFCLTALEAAASRTLVISSDLAALQNTVGDRGVMISGNPMTEAWKHQALVTLRYLIQNPEQSQILIERNYTWALDHSWKHQSELLLGHIRNYNLEYRGLTDWTSNVPSGSKMLFEKIVSYLKTIPHVSLLQLGAFTGTSLVGLLNVFSHSHATVIDTWNYPEYSEVVRKGFEQSFQQNIASFGDRVEVYKSDAYAQLIQLVQDHARYHLVHVQNLAQDPPENKTIRRVQTLDTHMNLVLAWKLLAQNGLMALDFVGNRQKLFESFVQLLRKEMRILFKDDKRWFIQKICL
jgi:tetratricopeptide (TPR) repeat protein